MATTKKTKISIIIPVYNVKIEFLEQCVISIKEQTFKDLEVLVINDGSEEKYSNYYDTLPKLDPRIRVIHQSNKGVSEARNTGLRKAKGEYVTFVDADDWVNSSMCKDAIEVLIENKADIVMWSNFKVFEDKRVPVKLKSDNKVALCMKRGVKEFNPYDMRLIGSVWGKLYSRDIISNEYFDCSLTHGEDVEFNFRIFSKANRFVLLNKYNYYYRYTNNSAVRAFNADTLSIYNKTLEKIKMNLEKKKIEKDSIEYNSFLNFVCIVYMVICSNYIFSSKNKISFFKKILLLKSITNSEIFKTALQEADLSLIPLSRRILMICGKFKMYYLIYFIVKVREIQCKLYRRGGK